MQTLYVCKSLRPEEEQHNVCFKLKVFDHNLKEIGTFYTSSTRSSSVLVGHISFQRGGNLVKSLKPRIVQKFVERSETSNSPVSNSP